MHSDRVKLPAVAGRWGRLASSALVALGLAWPASARAQQDSTAEDRADSTGIEAAADSLIGAAVSMGSDAAELEVQLSNGRVVRLELEDGGVFADGNRIGAYDEGGSLERSWRSLLDQAALASTAALPVLLREWEPPATAGAIGRELDARLEQALAGIGGVMMDTNTKLSMSAEDSIEELIDRIHELESGMHDRVVVHERSFEDEILGDFVDGIGMLFGAVVFLGVMLAIGAALLFFGSGRLEGVSATVREEPLRSGLIGLAGTFLFFPVWVLVILALAISVLGIPLILAWMPLFPLLFVLSGICGWLAVAYLMGDGLVSGKLHEKEGFQDASPTRRLAVGIGLLLSPFALSALFQMTSILDGAGALIFGLGVIANGLVACVGLGAVMSRARDAMEDHRMRRRERRMQRLAEQSVTQEGTNV